MNEKGDIRIPRVDTVVDVGTAVNPANIKAQFEGAAVFGTSIARSCEITATNGIIGQSNFHDYPVARIDEAPYQTYVYMVDSSAPPAGVGEPGVSLIAPALSNAIFAATGKRIRVLRLSKNRLTGGRISSRQSLQSFRQGHPGSRGEWFPANTGNYDTQRRLI